MLLAHEIHVDGMAAGNKFGALITDLIAKNRITKVIETGTYLGTGTSRAVVNGMMQHNDRFDFYTIEVNPQHHAIAKRNLGRIIGVHLMKGLSIPFNMVPTSTTFNVPKHVVVDYQNHNRDEMYRREVNFKVRDELLRIALASFDFKPELVILDSAGHLGFIEFQYLMKLVKGPFILCLDDTGHVKHYNTMEFIKANPERFKIIHELEFNPSEPENKFGSAVIAVS